MPEELDRRLETHNQSVLDANPVDLGTESPNSGVEDPNLQQAVDVDSEAIEGRQRRISAQIHVSYPREQIWQVLTDYEALASFIPNLSKSERVEHPAGGTRIEQVGVQRLLRFNFSARVILDMEECFPEEIRFQMVEGDFREFSGFWRLEDTSSNGALGATAAHTSLYYVVRVCPKRVMPVTLIERRLKRDLTVNLLAIQQRVNELFG